MMSVPTATFSDNEYKMKAYMTYKVKATGEIVTVYNKSRYQITFKATAPEGTPDTIYAVGSFNSWSHETGYITLTKSGDAYYADQSLLVFATPGEEAITFKFLSGLVVGILLKKILKNQKMLMAIE